MSEIVRNSSGKPEILDDLDGQVAVSLAHDHRYCVGVAGERAQGVDLEIVTHRTEQAWQALLGPDYHGILAELARSESMDRAGTRLWTVRECLYKAYGVRDAALSVVRQHDSAMVLCGRTEEHAECYILTVPLTFTLGTERMLAVVVELETEPAMRHAIPTMANQDTLATSGFDVSSYAMDGDAETRQFILRWPLTFKESANLDKSLYFTHYPEWMGKVREIAMQPIAEPFMAHMATGQWGMVTNHSAVQVLGEPRPGDVIEVRCWVQRASSLPSSTIDLHFDWRRIGRDNCQERIALSELQTTWVAVLGHGAVKSMPLPSYFQDFIDSRMLPDAEHFQLPALPETLKDLSRGRLLYSQPAGPTRGPTLARSVFETCLQDSNLIGNIYFATYYVWQARLVDRYVQPLIPHIYRAAGSMGELRCISTRVDHLVDAMPFENIEVVMSLEALYENGVTFGFDYFRVQPDNTKQKLAVGKQECVWLTKQEGTSVAGKLPPALMADLQPRTCVGLHAMSPPILEEERGRRWLRAWWRAGRDSNR